MTPWICSDDLKCLSLEDFNRWRGYVSPGSHLASVLTARLYAGELEFEFCVCYL